MHHTLHSMTISGLHQQSGTSKVACLSKQKRSTAGAVMIDDGFQATFCLSWLVV
jgi:hypothetical protein